MALIALKYLCMYAEASDNEADEDYDPTQEDARSKKRGDKLLHH